MFFAVGRTSQGTMRFYSFDTKAVRDKWVAVDTMYRQAVNRSNPILVRSIELNHVRYFPSLGR